MSVNDFWDWYNEHFRQSDVDEWVAIEVDRRLRTYFPEGAPSQEQASE